MSLSSLIPGLFSQMLVSNSFFICLTHSSCDYAQYCIFWNKTWNCLASKWRDSGENIFSVCKCLMEGRKGDGAGLFSWISCEGTRGNGSKLKYRKFHLELRVFIFLWRWSNSGTDCPEWEWSHYLWRYPDPTGHEPGQPSLADPAESRGLEPQVPFSLHHSMVQQHWAKKPIFLVLFPAILVRFKTVFPFPTRN